MLEIVAGGASEQTQLDIKRASPGAFWYKSVVRRNAIDFNQPHPFPYFATQSDVSCMLSPELFDDRRIQDAGRIVHIQVTLDQVEPLCRALDPRLLMLEVSWLCESPEQAAKLLRTARRWCAARSHLQPQPA